jgi:hypothetical protein
LNLFRAFLTALTFLTLLSPSFADPGLVTHYAPAENLEYVCPASALVRQSWRLEEGSDCLAGQAEICCHERLSRNIALRIVMSLRATATRAMSLGFPAATSLSRKLLSCRL